MKSALGAGRRLIGPGGTLAIVLLLDGGALAQPADSPPPAEPVLPCFLERAGAVPWRARPNAEAPAIGVFPSRITCSPEVVRDGNGNEFRYVEQDGGGYSPRCWFPAEAVHFDAARGHPAPAAWVAALRERIAEGKFSGASELGRAMEKLRIATAEAATARLAAAFASELSDGAESLRSRVASLRARGVTFDPDAPAPERAAAPAPGGEAHVGAVRLEVRRSPADGADLVGWAPLGARLRVEEVDGTWARVQAAAPFAPPEGGPSFVRAGRAKPPTSAGASGGWVRWAELLDSPLPAATALAARAVAHERAGRWADAWRDLDRAAALAPPEPALLARLRAAAGRSGRHVEAVEAERLPDHVVVAGLAQARVTLEPPVRCRGDRARAPVLEPERAFERWRRGGTVAPEALDAIPKDACLVPVRSQLCCGRGPGPGPFERRLALELPDGPWLPIEISVLATEMPRGTRLWVFELPEGGTCGRNAKALEKLRVLADVPWPQPGGTTRTWIHVDQARGSRGAVAARDAREARARATGLLRAACVTDPVTARVTPAVPFPRIDLPCGC